MTIVFDVYEDNGYGITKLVDTDEIEDTTLEEASNASDYYSELYSEFNSPKTDTSFFYFDNPRIK